MMTTTPRTNKTTLYPSGPSTEEKCMSPRLFDWRCLDYGCCSSSCWLGSLLQSSHDSRAAILPSLSRQPKQNLRCSGLIRERLAMCSWACMRTRRLAAKIFREERCASLLLFYVIWSDRPSDLSCSFSATVFQLQSLTWGSRKQMALLYQTKGSSMKSPGACKCIVQSRACTGWSMFTMRAKRG